MAMIKCPECGKDISSHAKMCNNCGFSLEYKVKLRLELYLTANQDVHNFWIVAFNGNKKIAEVQPDISLGAQLKSVQNLSNILSASYPYVLPIEVTFYGDINRIVFLFEEHMKNRLYDIECGEYEEEYIGLRCFERPAPNDIPTIQGGGYAYPNAFPPDVLKGLITFNHPIFEIKYVDYDDISPRFYPEVKYA